MSHAMGRSMGMLPLLASGLGDDTGGGLFLLTANGVEQLDALSSTGLAVARDGSSLARLLFTDDDPQTSGELLLYDARGVATYRRLDGLQEPHAAAWDGDLLAVVSTLANSILWLDPSGTPVREWRAPGDGDCWHLNSLLVRDGRLLASAFGRFGAHRGWAAPGARDGAGVVLDVERDYDMLSGLTCPHDVLPDGDGWLVCNSGERELLRLARDGRVLQRVPLDGWTRGLVLDDAVYVGVSASRQIGAEGRARVVALERASLRPLRTWELPCREVYALARVPPALVAGVRTGFATNAFRVREGVGIDHGAPLARQLHIADRGVRVERVEVTQSAPAGGWLTLRWDVRNAGGALLASDGEHAVVMGAGWRRQPADAPDMRGRARLPAPLGPGESASGLLRLATPLEPGRYLLRVIVGQEGIGWLDVGAGGCEPWEGVIEVTPSA